MAQLWSIVNARISFVGSSVVDLESNHPDVVEEMLASSVQIFPIGVDGVCRSRSGTVLWTPRVSAAQLTDAARRDVARGGSALRGAALDSCLFEATG